MGAVAAYFAGWSAAAIICLAVGLAFMVAEMFTPGMGLMGFIGIVALAAAVVLRADTFANGLITAGLILVILIVCGFFVYRSFRKGRLANSALVLNETIGANSTNLDSSDMQSLVGKRGVALTALRPSGNGEFDGKRVDVVTEGTFIQKGVDIVVERVEGIKVLVKPLDE